MFGLVKFLCLFCLVEYLMVVLAAVFFYLFTILVGVEVTYGIWAITMVSGVYWIIVRALIGNYFLSWCLMSYLLKKGIPDSYISLLNIVCVLTAYSLVTVVFGSKAGLHEVVLRFGLAFFAGVVGSSFVMVKVLKKNPSIWMYTS
ncbi:MAG: hypothetical protein COB04_05230 [Gammaproteobacteria bacterium]|nr:MAG: hypothetical protein COB04_05230 [Gammaproteobacteria bacterium]